MSLWSAPLKALLFKSVLLLALPLVYRLSELCVLSVHPSGMLHRGDHSTATLRPNPLCSEVGCWDAWWSIRKITHHAGMEVCRENRQTFYFQSPKTHKKNHLAFLIQLKTSSHKPKSDTSFCHSTHPFVWEPTFPVQTGLSGENFRWERTQGKQKCTSSSQLVNIRKVSFYSSIFLHKKQTVKIDKLFIQSSILTFMSSHFITHSLTNQRWDSSTSWKVDSWGVFPL